MNQTCGSPGCPAVFEEGPNRVYCDVHTEEHFAKHENLEVEYADEVECTLERMLDEARSTLHTLALNDEPDNSWHRYVAEQVEMYIPAVQAAVYEDEMWTAVRHALWVGLMLAHTRNAPTEAELMKTRWLIPHAKKQLDTTEKQAEAGRESRVAPDNETLLKDVRDRMSRGLSYTDACRKVGAACTPPVTARTVQNHTRELSPKKTGKR